MNPLDFDAFEIAAALAAVLDAGAVPYAIGGAIAYGLWGDPRGTHAVDINLFVAHEGLDAALDVLVAGGLDIDRDAARRADHAGETLVGRYQGMRVDLFTPSIPFSWEALETRVRVEGPRGAAWYLSGEATAVFKLLFFREKDKVDLAKLVAVQGANLDQAYVRRWLVEMMGEEDERVAPWDQLCERYG